MRSLKRIAMMRVYMQFNVKFLRFKTDSDDKCDAVMAVVMTTGVNQRLSNTEGQPARCQE